MLDRFEVKRSPSRVHEEPSMVDHFEDPTRGCEVLSMTDRFEVKRSPSCVHEERNTTDLVELSKR